MKDVVWNGIIIAYLCVCYFVPTIFGATRDPECTMRTGYANAMFGMIVIGASVLLKFTFVLIYAFKRCCNPNIGHITEFVQQGVIWVTIADGIITLIGWTIFFYWSQALWGDLGSSHSCTAGRNLWDFINWLCILSVTVWPAIFMTIGLCIGLCCLPCIIAAIKENMQRSANERT